MNALYKGAVEQFAVKTTELARLFRELGALEASVLQVRSQAWNTSDPRDNITTRRENADEAAVYFKQEVAKARGEIEAIQAELRYLDVFIQYLLRMEQTSGEGD